MDGFSPPFPLVPARASLNPASYKPTVQGQHIFIRRFMTLNSSVVLCLSPPMEKKRNTKHGQSDDFNFNLQLELPSG